MTPPPSVLWKSRTIKFILSVLVIVLLWLIVLHINVKQIEPSEKEIALLKSTYGNIDIKNNQDIIRIQNAVLLLNRHIHVNSNRFVLEEKLKGGLCFDRSIILQKIMIYNKISLRPVYLFHSGPTGTLLDFILPNTRSHSVFEVKLENKYYVIQTNLPMNDLREMHDYLKSPNIYISPNNTFVVYYLSNRNGRFLEPFFIPDIYYINY